ncbi:hypothetical protein P872_19785 [Rhodonellum psychrophilum GCM71 = DSM 17998]|uniref:Uncharacterized protein n=1 Tax=Rhodonellum psychrophilum GCM71 = DSM 17998 TaxID=1123057 RepID=U5BVS8_9BACT|nr:hypothetical protein P872_19785 [Rhodonellum psychrophilum GCM71 = DSM 17998]
MHKTGSNPTQQGLNPKYPIGFSIGVETARKSNHLGNKALSQNGGVMNCRQATDYESFLVWNGIGNAYKEFKISG